MSGWQWNLVQSGEAGRGGMHLVNEGPRRPSSSVGAPWELCKDTGKGNRPARRSAAGQSRAHPGAGVGVLREAKRDREAEF